MKILSAIVIILATQINCIKIQEDCNEDISKIELLNGINHIKKIVFIDMLFGIDADCLYLQLTKSKIPLFVFKEEGQYNSVLPHNHARKHSVPRSSDLAFVLLMSRPDINVLNDCSFVKLVSRSPKSFVIFIFYDITILAPVERLNHDKLLNFTNYILFKMKFVSVHGIILGANETVYYKYNTNNFHPETRSCGLEFSRRSFNVSGIMHDSAKLRVGYPVKIVVFERLPTSILVSNMRQFKALKSLLPHAADVPVTGGDGLLIADLVKHLKLKPTFVFGKKHDFGMQLKNGSLVGVLRDVVEKKVDISANSRFMTWYGAEGDYYYLGHNYFDRLCPVVPKSHAMPLWIQVITVYNGMTWTTLLCIVVMIAGLNWFHLNIIDNSKRRFLTVLLDSSFSNLVPVHRFRKTYHKILFVSIFIISTVFVPIFQGSIRSAFTKIKFYPDISTLEQLDKSFSKIHFGSTDKSLLFGRGISGLFDRLNDKIAPVNTSFLRILTMVAEDGIPFVGPRDDVNVFISMNNMQQRVLQLNDCPRQYFYAFICSTNFPWADEMEMCTLRLVEAGLPVWYQKMTNFAAQTHRQSAPHTGYVPVSLNLVTGPFIVYILGVLLSFISFAVEIYFR